jgi:hypothetical protein
VSGSDRVAWRPRPTVTPVQGLSLVAVGRRTEFVRWAQVASAAIAFAGCATVGLAAAASPHQPSIAASQVTAIVPAANVALVAGVPITRRFWKHWMRIAAIGQTVGSPRSIAIIATDPPAFRGCIAQVRKKIPSLRTTSDATIARDCTQLFKSQNATVLDYLIKSQWYLDEARRLGITPTAAEIAAAFRRAKAMQFSNNGQYLRFLRDSGETRADIRFRVRSNLIFTRLEKLEHGQRAVNRIAAAHWRPNTRCAVLYTIRLCS